METDEIIEKLLNEKGNNDNSWIYSNKLKLYLASRTIRFVKAYAMLFASLFTRLVLAMEAQASTFKDMY